MKQLWLCDSFPQQSSKHASINLIKGIIQILQKYLILLIDSFIDIWLEISNIIKTGQYV